MFCSATFAQQFSLYRADVGAKVSYHGSAIPSGGRRISPEALQKVLKDGGRLPLATVLRCRVRYFTDGAVLGSKAFVALQLAAYHQRTGRRHQTAPRPLPPLTEWGELTTLRGLRRNGFT